MSERDSLSVIFITLNEAFHIGAAIDNVKDIAKEVFVVDSGSTDETVKIAEAHGAKVLFHPFEGFGAQWNWALKNCPVTSSWTMKMDPDERLTIELKHEILEHLAKGDADGYEFDRVLWFMGRPLKAVKGLVRRIWRTGRCRFTDVIVNEHPLIEGNVVKLSGLMDHFDSHDLHHWMEKQNHYTTKEALIRIKGESLAAECRLFGASLERRMWIKRAFYYLPGRYILWFLYCYLWLGAWRSGYVGLAWAQMRVVVMRLTEYKWEEMEWTRNAIR